MGIILMSRRSITADGITYYDDNWIRTELIAGIVFLAIGFLFVFLTKKFIFKKEEFIDPETKESEGEDYIYLVQVRVFFVLMTSVFFCFSVSLFYCALTANTMDEYREKYSNEHIEVYPGTLKTDASSHSEEDSK